MLYGALIQYRHRIGVSVECVLLQKVVKARDSDD